MTATQQPIQLLPREAVIKTGDVDRAGWNYHPFLGPVQRKRFRAVVDLLADRRFHRILEIGYGSGVFMPELALHCDRLFGIDPHPKAREVEAVLAQHGIEASLTAGGAESLPFEDLYFDSVIAVSSMEYVDLIDDACIEIGRVLAPDGTFILITPRLSRQLDFVASLLTGQSAHRQYGDRRQRLLDVVFKHFSKVEEATGSAVSIPLLTIYTALKLRPKSPRG